MLSVLRSVVFVGEGGVERGVVKKPFPASEPAAGFQQPEWKEELCSMK